MNTQSVTALWIAKGWVRQRPQLPYESAYYQAKGKQHYHAKSQANTDKGLTCRGEVRTRRVNA